MSTADRLYVIAYDIAEEGRRRRVASLLERRAVRVQESVFETMLGVEAALRLQDELEVLLLPGDLLRLYPVPANWIDGIGCYGGAPPQRGASYWLL